jgi:hypothetical protein
MVRSISQIESALYFLKGRLELNQTHQLLVYADYVNLLGKNVGIAKKKTQKLY